MTRNIRRSLRTVVALSILVASLFGAQHWLTNMVRNRSLQAIADLCGPQSRVSIGKTEIRLLSGDVEWTDVRIDQPQDSSFAADDAHTFHLAGTCTAISVHRLSLLRLLFDRSLVIGALRISEPHLTAFFRSDTIPPSATSSEGMHLKAFRIEDLAVENGIFRGYRKGHAGAAIVIDQFDAHVTELITALSEGGTIVPRLATFTAEVSGITYRLSPLYTAEVACIEFSDGGKQLRVRDGRLRPLKGPTDYQTVVHFESDLIAAHVDTLSVDGLDLNACIGEGALNAGNVFASGATFNIHRDKTMPDGPKNYMCLPMRSLQRLPFRIRVDSLLMERWSIHYFEKGELSQDYGELLFSDVSGILTGLCTTDTIGKNEVHLSAHAKAYGQAPITVHIRTFMNQRNDRFTLNATIGSMPLDVFNRMTTDLVGMQATAGRIHGVDYSLIADDTNASGRVDIEYEGLKIRALKADGSQKKNDLKSIVLNELVHSGNLRSNANFRHGDFAFDREQDRSVFKYVWTGLREGLLAGMLPGTLDAIRKNGQDLHSR